MRLLMAMDDGKLQERIRILFYERSAAGYACAAAEAGEDAAIADGTWDVLLLQGRKGEKLGERLAACPPACLPVMVFLREEGEGAEYADCCLPGNVSPAGIVDILFLAEKKPLSRLAAAQENRRAQAVSCFLGELGMRPGWKGSSYARWCLMKCVPLPRAERLTMTELYGECARHFSTTGAAVERCLRAAVENVFTMGDIRGIERFFGSTIDPERGKPTNRVFLMQGVRQIRLLLDGAAFGKEQ